jgi:hypothetical protein
MASAYWQFELGTANKLTHSTFMKTYINVQHSPQTPLLHCTHTINTKKFGQSRINYSITVVRSTVSFRDGFVLLRLISFETLTAVIVRTSSSSTATSLSPT